jgi:hypothetical protein
MFRFCPACGDYRRDKAVDPDGPAVVCPACGHREPFRRLPLLLVGGASGVGKSTVRRELLGTVEEAVLLDVDAMWEPEFDAVVGTFDYNAFALRRCKQVAQNGRPTVLFGAETGLPPVVETSVERRYFAAARYLALVVEDALLRERLHERPNWPDADEAWTAVDDFVALNRCYCRLGEDPESPVETLDVTGQSVAAVADGVAGWIRSSLAGSSSQTPP